MDSVCVFAALSGSHTHSEPRVVIIFSKLLQTDRQTDRRTDRMDGQTDVNRQTGREREGSDRQRRGGLEAGPIIIRFRTQIITAEV